MQKFYKSLLIALGEYRQYFRRTAVAGDSLGARLIRGGLGSLCLKACHALLAFSLTVVLARVLGPGGYGIYSFALAIVMFAAIPSQIGLPQLIVRETAIAEAEGNWGLMRGLWRWANWAVLIISVVSVFVVGFILVLLGAVESGRNATVVMGIALIPIIALTQVRSACLRGLRIVVLGQFPESIIRPFLLLMLVGCSVVAFDLEKELGPEYIMTLHVIAAAITFAVGWVILWKLRPAGIKSQPTPRYHTYFWRKAVIPMALIAGLHLINTYADLIILGILRSDEEVGVYRAVFQIALLVIFGMQAMNQVVQPHFARIYRLGNIAALQRLITINTRIIFLLAVPPVFAFTLFGKDFLGLVYGIPYREGAIALAILSIGQLINASFGIVGPLLVMSGHERVAMRGISIAAVCNIILNIFFIPFWGIAGAALATSLSIVIWNYTLWRSAKELLKVNTSLWN